MGKTTPNRNANPVMLEACTPCAILRSPGPTIVDWYNESATLTQYPGEPIWEHGRVLLSPVAVQPGQCVGVQDDWIADFVLDPSHTGDILQGATIYWKIDAAKPNGIGVAVTTQPANGMLLGTAVPIPKINGEIAVNGSGIPICATTGSTHVRVMQSRSPAAYGSGSA